MSQTIPAVKVALGDDFLIAFSGLSKKAQKKTREFVEKFRSNPTSPGLNYETINATRDPNLRSLRVDQDHRAIVLKPEDGNTYIILWVDHHDDAYNWARNKVFSINPTTGGIQVLQNRTEYKDDNSGKEVKHAGENRNEVESPALFAPFSDADLLEIGVPELLLKDVREVRSNVDLDALEKFFPADAFEALYYLNISQSVDETKRELSIEKPESVDTHDFGKALERETSKRKFILLTDHEEMEKVLAYPLDRWRTFLHPSQRKIVEMNARGPVRVLGGAGTGKTVVAIHRARWIAEKVCNRDEKVLFTTFTRNLAMDIEYNLKKICSQDLLNRIEIKNLDAWASQFLAAHNAKTRQIDFKGDTIRDLWDKALNLAPMDSEFDEEDLWKEWEYVVQAQGIREKAAYIRAPRIGMGKALSRTKRSEIWPVFEEFLCLQKEAGVCEPIEVLKAAREYIENQRIELDYRAVIIDEAQDFSAEGFKLANALVSENKRAEGNHLFIVGDAHQRLYGHKVILSHCGIDIRGRSRRLRINYRTSEETRNWATSVLENCPIDDLDGGMDSHKGYRSLFHGEDPIINPAIDNEKQTEAIIEHIQCLRDQQAPLESICVVARNNKLVDALQSSIQRHEVPCTKITRDRADNAQTQGVRFATMHRVKGIEFDHMILAHMEEPVWSSRSGSLSVEDRCLIHVAATRARKSVYVTSAGPLVAGL